MASKTAKQDKQGREPKQLEFDDLSPSDLREHIALHRAVLNEKQNNFIDGVLRGEPLIKAYKTAGYTASNDNSASVGASRLLRSERISTVIKMEQQEARLACNITKNELINHQHMLMRMSAEQEDLTGSSRICAELSKLIGYYPDPKAEDVEVDEEADTNLITDEEYQQFVAYMAVKAGDYAETTH